MGMFLMQEICIQVDSVYLHLNRYWIIYWIEYFCSMHSIFIVFPDGWRLGKYALWIIVNGSFKSEYWIRNFKYKFCYNYLIKCRVRQNSTLVSIIIILWFSLNLIRFLFQIWSNPNLILWQVCAMMKIYPLPYLYNNNLTVVNHCILFYFKRYGH